MVWLALCAMKNTDCGQEGPSGDLYKEDLRSGQQGKNAYSGTESMKVERIKRNKFNQHLKNQAFFFS